MAQHRVVETESVLDFRERFVVALDVHQNVVRLVDLVDRVGELAASPVFEAVQLAVARADRLPVALDHRGHLLALIGMDDEYDFVVTHGAPCGWRFP